MGNTQPSGPPPPAQPLRAHVLRTQQNESPRSAVILGATGATGKFMLTFMLQSPEWNKVSIIHRRAVDLDALATKCKVALTEEQKSKVTQHVIDMEKMCDNEESIANNVELFKGHDVVFCVLGTKRAIAGTAENFKKIDLYMVRDAAILSEKAGVPHFSLLSTKNANANLWANDWKITHGLLYLKVKGDAEQAVIAQNCRRCSIFRPSFLAREEGEGGGMMNKLPVRDLAAVIMYDAESDDVGGAEQNNDVDEKESKQENDEPQEKISAPIEKHIIYESTHISNVLVSARKNFDAVCGSGGGEQRSEVTEQAPPMSNQTESEEKEKGNEEEPQRNGSSPQEVPQEQNQPNVDDNGDDKSIPSKNENEADAETQNNDDIEVVDKPLGDNNADNDDNDYVDVQNE